VKKPPNIKFDPRSKSSPFFGLTPVTVKQQEPTGVAEATTQHQQQQQQQEEDYEDYDQDDFDTHDDDDDFWFDVSAKLYPQLIPIIPLPERLHVNVLDKIDASLVGTLHLHPIVFGQADIRVDIMHRVVQYQRAKKRGRRTALAKTIATVSGSGRKVRPQKGGGTSRAGHRRPPHWKGGARAHGPKGIIHDYTQSLNKKVRKLGMVHALSQKLQEQNLIVVNDFMLDSHRTKDLGAFLMDHFKVGGRLGTSAILCDYVHKDTNENTNEDTNETFQDLPIKLIVAAGNLSKVKVLHQQYLNVFDLLKYEKLILTVGAIEMLEKRFKNATY
jgi:large subunit ribosomal protein L4